MKIDIRDNIAELQRKYSLLPEELARAVPRSINRTMIAVRKEGTDNLRPLYPGIKVGGLLKRIRGEPAKAGLPLAKLTFLSGRFNMYGNFGMQGFDKFGVRFRKLPWKIETLSGDEVSPEMMARAFRNRLRAGGRATVFSRWSKHRLSAEILVVPGLSRAYVERHLGAKLATVARKRFPEVFLQQARFLLSKRSLGAWVGV